MSKINKIKLSGTTYEVEDKEAVKTVTLTQAEYDALQTKDPSIFYVISDGQGGGSGSSAVEVTQAEYDALVSGGTLDPSVLYIITDAVGGDLSNYMTSAQTMNAISAATSTKQDILSAGTGIDITDNTISVTGGGITSGEVQDMIDESVSGKVDTTTFNTYSGAVDTTLSGKQDTLSAGTNITITDNVISAQLEGGTVSRGDVEDMIEEATSGLQETLSAGTGIEIDSANTISCTVSGKTYSAGTNISIDANDTIKCTIPFTATTKPSYNFGRYNSVEDGYNFWAIGLFNTLNKGTGYDEDKIQFVYGSSNTIKGARNFVFGYLNQCNSNNTKYLTDSVLIGRQNNPTASGSSNNANVFLIGRQNNNNSHSNVYAYGYDNKFNNDWEFTIGKYNNSVSDGTESGNTFFSVGNGTAYNARHNAFEIRQNGDIYITSGGTDIKLQDHLGGGGGGMTEDDELLLSTALTDLNDRKADKSLLSNYQRKGDYVTTSTLNTRLAEYETALDEQNVEEVTAYALNDLNNRFGGLSLVKITESEYAALTTKDENTLYVVIADPE